MAGRAISLARAAAFLALPFLAACDILDPVTPVLTPQARPVALPAALPPAPSESSAALRTYYSRILNEGLTQGLLRTDGGGPDTPFTATMLQRNFEEIAFYSEYQRGAQPLRRWDAPVRIEARFGASVPPADETRDRNALVGYANRLARVTGHPISVGGPANFHVFFAGEDDRADVIQQIRAIEPRIDNATLRTISDLPRETYCLVIAFTPAGQRGTYTRAIALIRAEQPDLMRLSCIHEEVAQGLGLANDSPAARPSIFNDDDEFALLTNHDEALLRLLYDPRLRTGMSLSEARPLLPILTREEMGEEL